MKDRNTRQELERDIEFIKDVHEKLESNYIEDAWDMLNDWKDELESLTEGR